MSVNVGRAVAYLELDTSKFTSGFKSALSDLKVFGDKSATTEQKVRGVSKSFEGAGKVLTRSFTVPLAGVGIASVNVAKNFESGMSKVKAISGATGKDFDKLKQKALEMGNKTKYSATESAQAFEYMAMAGWKTEDMLDGIEGVMNLAAASGEDLAIVSDIVTDSMTAFGLSAKDSAHFADVLAKASSSSNTNVGMMGETFKYVAPVAGAMGYSIEDTAVAIGLMANAGIKGSQAGTALRSMLTRLAKPTDQVAEAMNKYNISLTDAQGNMLPFSDLIVNLRDKFKGLSEAEQINLATTLAGQEGMSGLLAIVGASDEDFKKLTEQINNANGASKEMADTMIDNLTGAVQLLKSALETAGITIGEKLTPYIRSLAEWITKLTDKFNSMSESQQDMVVKFGMLLLAIGPVLIVASKLLTVGIAVGKMFKFLGGIVSNASTIFKVFKLHNLKLAEAIGLIPQNLTLVIETLSGMLAPILAVVTVVGTLVGAFVHLWKMNEDFRNKITEIWSNIKETISGFVDQISDKFTTIRDKFQVVVDAVKILWESLCNIISPLFVGAFEEVSIVLQTVLDLVIGFVDILTGIFTGDWETLWQGVQEVFSSVWNFIIETLGNFIQTIVDISNNLLSEFGTSWEQIWTSVSELFVNIWNNIVSFVTTTIPQIIQNIIQWFQNLPYNIGVFLGQVYLFFINLGTNIWSWITNDLPQIIQAVVDWFAQLPSRIWNWLVSVITNIVTWGADMLSKGKTVAKDFVTAVIDFIKTLPDKVWDWVSKVPQKVSDIGSDLYDAGADIFSQLWDGIKSIGDSITSWVSDFADGVKSVISGIIDGFNSVVSSADEAKKASKEVDGKHAGGLSFVPFDGYRAELHRGERVLTKNQNEEYNEGKGSGKESGDTYIFYNTKPTPYEYSRQMKKAKKELKYGF